MTVPLLDDDLHGQYPSTDDSGTEDAIPRHADTYVDAMPYAFANVNPDEHGDTYAPCAGPPPGPQSEVVVLTVPAPNLSFFAAFSERVRQWARRVARRLYDWTRGTSWRQLIPFRPYMP